jgi:hypothetical protein
MLITILSDRGSFDVTCDPRSTPASILEGMRARFPSLPESGRFLRFGEEMQYGEPIGPQGVRAGDTVVIRWN